MDEYVIRECRGVEDAGPQYDLWLRATEGLPRAWRSCLRNVEHQLAQATRYPGCRLYAHDTAGRLLGYIGTHPPFEWIGAQHGPPTEPLGWTVPFGYPWTDPVDESLERALYDEMIRTTPVVYSASPRDLYIQRFRESWTRPLAFLEHRGWRRHTRLPLFGKDVGSDVVEPGSLFAVQRGDLKLVSALSEADPTMDESFSVEDLRGRYDAGWLVADTFWRYEERGAFALEPRGRWAAVTLFVALPGEWDGTLRVAAAQARMLGAREIYFTIDVGDSKRLGRLRDLGFGEVDAGVYYARDADPGVLPLHPPDEPGTEIGETR